MAQDSNKAPDQIKAFRQWNSFSAHDDSWPSWLDFVPDRTETNGIQGAVGRQVAK
jgi:hypothetical protein